jgi:hypothetical protein
MPTFAIWQAFPFFPMPGCFPSVVTIGCRIALLGILAIYIVSPWRDQRRDAAGLGLVRDLRRRARNVVAVSADRTTAIVRYLPR